MKIFYLTIILLLLFQISRAQTFTGCLITDGQNQDLYTNISGNVGSLPIGTCGSTTSLPVSNVWTKRSARAGCKWSPSVSNPASCVIRDLSTNRCGVLGTYTLNCPIDDFIFLLIFPISLFALMIIRNKYFTYYNLNPSI